MTGRWRGTVTLPRIGAILAILLSLVVFLPGCHPRQSGGGSAAVAARPPHAVRTSRPAGSRRPPAAAASRKHSRPATSAPADDSGTDGAEDTPPANLRTTLPAFRATLAQCLGPDQPTDDQLASLLVLPNDEILYWMGQLLESSDPADHLGVLKGLVLVFGDGKDTVPGQPKGGGLKPFTEDDSETINRLFAEGVDDDDQAVRYEAVNSVLAFNPDIQSQLWHKAITSEDDSIRLAVVQQTASLGSDDLLTVQFQALDDDNAEIRALAAETVRRVTGKAITTSDEAYDWLEQRNAAALSPPANEGSGANP